MDENTNLTRRQRRALQRAGNKNSSNRSNILKKFAFGAILLVLLGGFIYWITKQTSKPIPGEAVTDLGREHVTDIFGIQYNSNPPTSGSHFPMWAKKGVYDRLISDGYLLHSL